MTFASGMMELFGIYADLEILTDNEPSQRSIAPRARGENNPRGWCDKCSRARPSPMVVRKLGIAHEWSLSLFCGVGEQKRYAISLLNPVKCNKGMDWPCSISVYRSDEWRFAKGLIRWIEVINRHDQSRVNLKASFNGTNLALMEQAILERIILANLLWSGGCLLSRRLRYHK